VADIVQRWGETGLAEGVRTPDEAVRAIEHVVGRPRGPFLAVADEALARISWDRTWAGMLDLMRAKRRAGRIDATRKRLV
jgi:hypothetical protein